MKEKYYLGLDIGTSSVGWAVTDCHYNLFRKKGRDLWGARLFDEANTAVDRRTKRVARRRLEREHHRIAYLKSIFEEEINRIDPGFFARLDDSKFYMEDKREHQPFSLFAGEDYTDKDYHAEFPTIFHLRNTLIQNKKQYDVRLVYLAILNIYKHRGHFLNAGMTTGESGREFTAVYDNMIAALEEKNQDFRLGKKNVKADKVQEILASRETSKTKKYEELLKIYGLSKVKDKPYAEFFKLLTGMSALPVIIFFRDEYSVEEKKTKLSFQSSSYEEDVLKVADILDEDAYEIIMTAKEIYDKALLVHIMQGKKYLSEARIESYNKHKKDLGILKNIYHQMGKAKYDEMFRIMDDYNYSAYVGSVNSGKQVQRHGGKKSQTELYAMIKKDLKSVDDSAEKTYILDEIEKESFLPKQLTGANGVIPNQLHKEELEKILENVGTYLPFLCNEDASGLSAAERLVKMFEFQIPYYIGPLTGNVKQNEASERKGWSVRKKDGKIYPWNFEEMIDTKVSAERFINNMVKCCTYVSEDKVLPKDSLLYEKYMILNELNALKINEERITPELKQNIYNELFITGKKVTEDCLIKYLKRTGVIGGNEDVKISGIDHEFTNKRANYAKFTAIFKTDVLSYEQEKMAEQIIYWSAIYGDSKKFLKEKIEETYSEKLTKEQIKRILGYKFKDWGNLSASLLKLEGADKDTGEICTVISRMWDENKTLTELIRTDRYTYREEIEKKTKTIDKELHEITYADIEESYSSAPVRRMIWQTVLVVKEIVKVMKSSPDRIFIEMTRGDEVKGDQGRKDSRKKLLEDCYKNCEEDSEKWIAEIGSRDEKEFRSRKLYLYYTQMGRDMYTGEPIPIENLFQDNYYDVDHIYPRSLVKDDSLTNNLVLTKKEINNNVKKDIYPIGADIRRNQYWYWKNLRDWKLISEEKFKRLTRDAELSDKEREKFIARQLVETGQATKSVADVFKGLFDPKQTEIIYSKAGNVSWFRNKYKIEKCRCINDFHHAQDAYLNIVVGNVYYVKFTKNLANFIKEWRKDPKANHYNMERVFDFDVKRENEFAWHGKNGTSIATVKKVMKKNTPLISRRNAEVNGGFYDENIVGTCKTKNGIGYIPVKTTDKRLSDVKRYGGYGSVKVAFFFLVEYEDKKGKTVRSIEDMPVYLKQVYKTREELEVYCKDVLGYKNPSVRIEQINRYSLLKINGFFGYITGKTGNSLTLSSAVQMKLSPDETEYIRILDKEYNDHADDNRLEKRGIGKEKNMKLFQTLTEKHSNGIYSRRPNSAGKILETGKEKFENLNLKDQSYILKQILRLSTVENQGVDFYMIGGKKRSCKAGVNKKISELMECKLIRQSITGIYEDQIDLLKV